MANIFGFGDIKNDPPQGGPPGGGGPPGFPGGFPSAPKEPEAKRIKFVTSQAQFNQEISSAQGLVVVDWAASWFLKTFFDFLVFLLK